MKNFSVYIIRSQKTGKYYIGHTDNISRRLAQHNNGFVRATKPSRPWQLIYIEKARDKNSAYRREFQIKRYKGGNAFKKLVQRGMA